LTKNQPDRAVAYIYDTPSEGTSIHRKRYAKADNMMFICWQDITIVA
jgi:hypothetical protein